jgi:hypothetical protein
MINMQSQTQKKIRVAENKTKVMRTLNYSVVHNIMSPLQSISLLAEVLLGEMGLMMNSQMITIV